MHMVSAPITVTKYKTQHINVLLPFTRGYKDGLQPESLADGNWLVKQKQPVSKIETKSDKLEKSI